MQPARGVVCVREKIAGGRHSGYLHVQDTLDAQTTVLRPELLAL
jgi:hypothetical protein